MQKGRLEVVHTIPSPDVISKIVRRFGSKKYGLVTSLGDSFLPSLKASLDDTTLIDVVPLGTVVSQYHRLTGQETFRLVTGRQLLSAIAFACSELGSESPFRKVVNFPGFHDAVRSCLQELSHHEIAEASLRRMAELVEPDLALKLLSLADISRDVEAMLEEVKVTTASSLMANSLDATVDLDGQESRLLIFAESEFHPLALKWIQWIVSNGAEVQIVFSRHATDGNIFQSSDKSIQLLTDKKTSPGEGNLLLNNLFSQTGFGGASLDWVEVHAAGDAISECEWAIRKIQSLPDASKCAILVRDMATYGPLLQSVGERFKEPVSVRRRVNLLSNGFCKFTFGLLSALADSDVRKLEILSQSSYIGRTKEMESWLRGVLSEAHQATGNQWEALVNSLPKAPVDQLEMFEEEPEVQEDTEIVKVLRYVLDWRRSALESSRSFVDWHAHLKLLLEKSAWFESAIESITELRDQRGYTAMLSNLAQDAVIEKVLERGEISFPDWVRHVEKVWDSSDVSVPGLDDGIMVAQNPSELGETDFLFVLGLLEGVFPKRRRENAILTDDEKAQISGLLETGPKLLDSFDEARTERDLFYSVCAAASKGLYLSYPLGDGNSESIPAFYLEEVKRICGLENQEHFHPRRHLTPVMEECLNSADKILAEALLSVPDPFVAVDLETEVAKGKVQFDLTDVQPRELRTLVQCNFKFAASRNLPEPKSDRDRWGGLITLPEKSSLLTLPDRDMARHVLYVNLEAHLDSIHPHIEEWEYEMISHGAPKLIEGWIQREFAARELWVRDPSKTKVGVKFGEPGLIQSRMGYQLSGRVAGVTEDRGIRRVHLYRRRAPRKLDDNNTTGYLAEFGMYFASAWDGVESVEVEIESLEGLRTLLMYLPPGAPMPDQNEELVVLNLAVDGASKGALKSAMDEALRLHKPLAMAGSMATHSGDHCKFCSYGDLCRRSSEGGEESDPFAEVGG